MAIRICNCSMSMLLRCVHENVVATLRFKQVSKQAEQQHRQHPQPHPEHTIANTKGKLASPPCYLLPFEQEHWSWTHSYNRRAAGNISSLRMAPQSLTCKLGILTLTITHIQKHSCVSLDLAEFWGVISSSCSFGRSCWEKRKFFRRSRSRAASCTLELLAAIYLIFLILMQQSSRRRKPFSKRSITLSVLRRANEAQVNSALTLRAGKWKEEDETIWASVHPMET